MPNTTETDLDGNVKEVVPSPDGNYDGSVSYVTSIADVVLTNTGFGYQDGDTVVVDGDGDGQAEVELINEAGS